MARNVTVKVNRAGRAQINEAAAYGVLGAAVAVLGRLRANLPGPGGRSGRATGRMRDESSAALYMRQTEVAAEGGSARAPDEAVGEIVAVVGMPFPGRFYETGTVKQAAHPVLGPAADATTVDTIEQETAKRWPR